MRGGIMSDDGVSVTLQGGTPVGWVPDGSDDTPAKVILDTDNVAVSASNGGGVAIDGGTFSALAGLGAASINGASAQITARTSTGIKLSSFGDVTLEEYASGGAPQNLKGVKNLSAESLTVNGVDVTDGDWIKLSLVNGWVDYVGGGGYRGGLWVRKMGDNVQIQGMIKSGSGEIATLPAGLRPPYSAMWPAIASAASAGVFYGYDPATGVGKLNYLFGPTAPSYLNVTLLVPLH